MFWAVKYKMKLYSNKTSLLPPKNASHTFRVIHTNIKEQLPITDTEKEILLSYYMCAWDNDKNKQEQSLRAEPTAGFLL